MAHRREERALGVTCIVSRLARFVQRELQLVPPGDVGDIAVGEHAAIVLAQHRRLVMHPAHRSIGKVDTVFVTQRLQRRPGMFQCVEKSLAIAFVDLRSQCRQVDVDFARESAQLPRPGADEHEIRLAIRVMTDLIDGARQRVRHQLQIAL